MSMEQIEERLNRAIGLEAASLGRTTVELAVRRRLVQCGLTDLNEYVALLDASATERDELIEEIVVPETWFFRDRELFSFLARYVVDTWLPAHPTQQLRVLSVPCATGEEPYSIAIALLEAGVPPQRFEVHGVDISRRALELALAGEYRQNAFRGDRLDFRDRHFRPTPNGWSIEPRIRDQVRFFHGILLQGYVLRQHGPYSIVFCRNLLIYLDRPARQQVLTLLAQLLEPEGLLFVGHAESGQVPAEFPAIPTRSTFAFRRPAEAVRTPVLDAHGKVVSRPERTAEATKLAGTSKALAAGTRAAFRVPRAIKPKTPAAEGSQREAAGSQTTRAPLRETAKVSGEASTIEIASPVALLAEAQRLADAGKLAEAGLLCERYVQQSPAVPEVYFLWGVVLAAAGDQDGAESKLHKAVYLNPGHYEALSHLALICERRGDTTGAANFRRRATASAAKSKLS